MDVVICKVGDNLSSLLPSDGVKLFLLPHMFSWLGSGETTGDTGEIPGSFLSLTFLFFFFFEADDCGEILSEILLLDWIEMFVSDVINAS